MFAKSAETSTPATRIKRVARMRATLSALDVGAGFLFTKLIAEMPDASEHRTPCRTQCAPCLRQCRKRFASGGLGFSSLPKDANWATYMVFHFAPSIPPQKSKVERRLFPRTAKKGVSLCDLLSSSKKQSETPFFFLEKQKRRLTLRFLPLPKNAK